MDGIRSIRDSLVSMSGTIIGAIRGAARRLGLSEADYREQLARGLKWCHGCRKWHQRVAFGSDRHRLDGLAAICLVKKAEAQKANYRPQARPKAGRRFVPAREGDKHQARRRVNHLVAVGLLPPPAALPCCDCQHIGANRRHGYDHFLGYTTAHHEHVQAVCSRCHRKRAIARAEWARRK